MRLFRRRVQLPRGPVSTLKIKNGDMVLLHPAMWNNAMLVELSDWLTRTGRPDVMVVMHDDGGSGD